MLKNILRKWGFIIAGVLFFFAALTPYMEGKEMNVTFFVLGITFFILGASVARKKREASPPSK